MVLIGSCPWPGPWSWSYGAHLLRQAREDQASNGVGGPAHSYFRYASVDDHCRVEGKAKNRSADAPGRPLKAFGARAFPPIGAGVRGPPFPIAPLDASIVSAYFAIGDEADPAPLLDLLREARHRIALPRVVGRGKPLDFHLYEVGR